MEKIVIVGGGYAGLCFAEEYRKLDGKSSIILFSAEEFCSRPSLFFRFKFPGKDVIDYGRKTEHFFESYNIIHQVDKVVKVNPVDKILATESGESYEFTRLILCTGSLPNYMDNKTMKVLRPNFEDYNSLKLDDGIFIVRNIHEVDALHGRIKSLAPSSHIVIVGSGALCVDILSNLYEGYLKVYSEKKDDDLEKSPFHITVLSRRDVIGFPLLDLEGAKVLTERVLGLKDSISILQDEIGEIKSVGGHITAIKTAKGQDLKCDILIQSLGVHSNTTLDIGTNIKDGYCVNSTFECISDRHPSKTFYAIGDCAEIVGEESSRVYLNWTMAREQAVQLAKHFHDQSVIPSLTFSQTLRLFGFYVACLGDYHLDGIVKVRSSKSEYLRLVFKKSGDLIHLVGAVVLGDQISHYQTGIKILAFIKTASQVDATKLDEMIQKDYPWGGEKKILKKFVNPIKKRV